MQLRILVLAALFTVATANHVLAQAGPLGTTASATVSAGIGNGLQNNSGPVSATATATATSPCLPFGTPCTGTNTASAVSTVTGNNINLVTQVGVGQTVTPIIEDFNTANAIASGGYNDVISFGVENQGSIVVLHEGMYKIIAGNGISGNFQFAQTGMQLTEQLTIPLTDGTMSGGNFSLVWNGSEFEIDPQSSVSTLLGNLIFRSTLPVSGVSELADIALSVNASLNTLITGNTSCCALRSTFSDPIGFEVLDSNGNIVPNLVVQSELGFQYSVVDGFDAETPIPATLPLFASGLGALSLLGWRRKRKA